MDDQPVDPKAQAFFRWQEWIAFRRNAVPTREEPWGDLLAAESKLLAALGEHEAAAQAAERALLHYLACEDSDELRAKIAEAAKIAGTAGAPVAVQEPTSAVDESVREATPVNPAELLASIRATIESLSGVRAQNALRTLNALRSTPIYGPEALGVRVVQVLRPARGRFAVTPFVLDLVSLERSDPAAFRALVRRLGQKASRDRLSDWGGLNVPEPGEPT
jgi:hypothetical protein